jgi:hypothetical protein
MIAAISSNPMGYTGPIRSAKFSTGVTEIMTRFVAYALSDQDIRTSITGVLKYITNPTFHALRSWWIVYMRTRWPFTEGYGRMLVPFLFSFETLSDWGKWFFTARPAR